MSLVVLCPTRGRPAAAWEAYYSLQLTAEQTDTRIVFVIDRDDPEWPNYAEPRGDEKLLILTPEHAGGMVNALNAAALDMASNSDATVLGFIGDDHRFRSKGWDRVFRRRLMQEGGGLAYGNDLFWPLGEIPTQIFMSIEIVRALGWMGLPGCDHLYIDNAWMAIGEALERIFYFPNFIVEHMHPAGGKGVWDDSYRKNNSEERYSHDRAAFESWRASPQFQEDVERVRLALAVPTV